MFCGGALLARTTRSNRVRPVGVWAGDGGLDRLATPPRAGRVLASSTAKGIPGARLDWSAGCSPVRSFTPNPPFQVPPVGWSCHTPVSPSVSPPVRLPVRLSTPPRCGPRLCSLPVTAQLHCNQPQPGSSETQILHKSRQRAAPPVALVHIWRLNNKFLEHSIFYLLQFQWLDYKKI